jgi:endonuclease/exonuclease/phosphatase (EEP) superfamily protein YafD
MKNYLKIGLLFVAKRALWLSLIGAILGSFAIFDWRLELFSHFLPFYGFFIAVGVMLERQKYKRLFLLMMLAFICWQLKAAWFVENSWPVKPHAPFRLIAMNVFLNNTEYENTQNWLLAQQADAIFLTEATPLWQSNLLKLQKSMPYGCAIWEDSPFGLAILLKTQPIKCEIFSSEGLPPYVRVELASHVVIYGIHPPPPLGSTLAAARNLALKILAQRIAAEKSPVIVLGDMNITPYSPLYQAFRHDANLNEVGFSASPTWSPLPILPPILPLDRSLVRGVAANLKIGPNLGSDHRAIVLNVDPPSN